jgi:hypothetical protein
LKISKSSASSSEPCFFSSSSSCNFNSKPHAEEKGKKGCPGNMRPIYDPQKKSTTHVQIDDNQSETIPAVHAGSYNSLCAWMIRALSRAQRVGKLQKQNLVSIVSFQNLCTKKT